MESSSTEIIYFEKLTENRSTIAKALENVSVRGIWNSIVEKYTDKAHFVYELLQNADDAKATKAKFLLREDGLIFIHNGTVQFTVSDPDNEEEDTKNKNLGHINSITSVANSNKNEATIGKFGVGFKSVFQYTNTPHIYNGIFKFKIENYIVPKVLDHDYPDRENEDTLFYFPFDLNQDKAIPYSDIKKKLKSLKHPVLFLTSLKKIQWESNNETGSYSSTILNSAKDGDITYQFICDSYKINNNEFDTLLWLFSEQLEKGLRCSVGYAINSESKKLRPLIYPAYCYFPTKETTNLSFIINAPFLLTDSREGIKAGNRWNIEMVDLLAQLAANSLVILKNIGNKNGTQIIDDDIFNIIPYKPHLFGDSDNGDKISFLPFYECIYDKLKEEELLPTQNGQYVSRQYAYWASDPDLIELISDDQLEDLLQMPGAKWVFTKLGRKTTQASNKDLFAYIDGGDERYYAFKEPNLIKEYLDPEKILKLINKNFIEKQTIEWLNKLYMYLSDRASYQNLIKNKPIFVDDYYHAVEAFDENGQLKIFLPSEVKSEFPTINKEFLKYPKSLVFFELLQISEPSLRDEVVLRILPLYQESEIHERQVAKHFIKIFEYYRKCPNDELNNYILELSENYLVICETLDNKDELILSNPNESYIRTEELTKFFEVKPDTNFIYFEFYKNLIDPDQEGLLKEFFKKIGVNEIPKRNYTMLGFDYEIKNKFGLTEIQVSNKYYSLQEIHDLLIDGLLENINCASKERSILIWEILLLVKSKYNPTTTFEDLLFGKFTYYPAKQRYSNVIYFKSSTFTHLHESSWILNKHNNLCKPQEITFEELSDDYDKTSENAKELIEFLGIKQEQENLNLTADQSKAYEIGKAMIQKGFSEDDLPEILSFLAQKALKKQIPFSGINELPYDENSELNDLDSVLNKIKSKIKDRKSKTGNSSIDDFTKSDKSNESENGNTDESLADEDEYIKPSKDYSKIIEKIETNAQNEIEKITKIQELMEAIQNTEKYSYQWFISLLELEYLNSYESNNQRKGLTIEFSKVEFEKDTKNMIVLKNSNLYIPLEIESIENLSMKMYFGSESKTIPIDVVSAKQHSLKAKLKDPGLLSDIDLREIIKAVIDIKNPIFILEQLFEKFKELELDNDFNLKDNLTKNIEFIFGPPGTGKTTYLAREVLTPLMEENHKLKVLVLTPTNKAADVLVQKIFDVNQDEEEVFKWLRRFGKTEVQAIEESIIFTERDFDISKFKRIVVVTTIARFTYDYFKPEGSLYVETLRDIGWDYIVIDEASMITLPSIVYPLCYKKKKTKFIIAGDPFQIQPIASVSEWKDENIYSMVELNKFSNPTTTPHPYNVINLTTQYRSIPSIGSLFSDFTYEGILEHYRNADSQKKIQIENFDLKDINIVKFPVNKLHSLFRSQRLKNTSYHIYSALLSYGLTNFLINELHKQKDIQFKVGIICPYKAQADIVEEIFSKLPISSANVDFYVGTIHGFQGDECDIIITIFNPPPYLSESEEMFLNKQNILNVSISRAKDYLFILMPNNDTENIDNIKKVKLIEELIKRKGEEFYNIIDSHEIEKLIFKDEDFLEKNSFITTHQSINVYKESDYLFEIRSENNAVDLQIDPRLNSTGLYEQSKKLVKDN